MSVTNVGNRAVRRPVVWVAGLGAVAGLIAGGASVGVVMAEGGGASRVAAPPAAYAQQTTVGLGMSAADAASHVRVGLASADTVANVSTTVPPDGSGGAPWVVTTFSAAPANIQEKVRDEWLGSLAQGAVSDDMATNQTSGSSVIGGAEVALPGPAGSPATLIPLGVGNVAVGQSFAAPSDADLLGRVASVAAQFGLTVNSASIVKPLGSALEVRLTIPASATPRWTIEDLRAALVGRPVQLDGALITLQSPAGEPLLVSGVSYRSGDGYLWFASGQDGRFGAVHGSLLGAPTGRLRHLLPSGKP